MIIGFGTDNLHKITDESAINLMKHALNFAYTHKKLLLVDTAKIYDRAEELMGKFIDEIHKTQPVQLASLLITIKIGITFTEKYFVQTPHKLRLQIKDSLKKLNHKKITYYIHKPNLICILHRLEIKNTNKGKMLLSDNKWIRRFKVLKEFETIFYGFGVSEVSLRQLIQSRRCAQKAGIQINWLQAAYSLWIRRLEINGVYEYCQEHNINFMAYTTLCRGFINKNLLSKNKDFRNHKENQLLQGKIFSYLNIHHSFIRQIELFNTEYINHNFIVILKFYHLCKKWKKNPAQVAIQYSLKRNTIPILSQSSLKHLISNLKAYKLNALSDKQVTLLRNLFPYGSIKGDPNMGAITSGFEDDKIYFDSFIQGEC